MVFLRKIKNMKSLKQIMIETATRKYAKQAARPAKKPPINNRFIALMLLPNERIQAMILGASQSTYVPLPKGDHSIMANIDRFRKLQKRNAAWTGLRS